MKKRDIIGFCFGLMGTLLGTSVCIKYGKKLIQKDEESKEEDKKEENV